MLTPIFSLNQDDDFINLRIKAPHASIKECDIEFEDRHFTFYAQPYFLRLYFPKKIKRDGREKVEWDSEECVFRVRVPKLNKGELFEDLDMLTKLLSKPAREGPMIEVVGAGDEDEEEDFDWETEQVLWTEEDEALLSGHKYGFANTKTGMFGRNDELSLAIDLKEPEKKNKIMRRNERQADETEHFDDDHYLNSVYEDREEIDRLIELKALWDGDCKIVLTDDDAFRLKNLPKKEYLLDRDEKMRAYFGLVDILYAYAYDVRTTEGEHTSESNWTICKLSATLSWFESYDNLKDTLITCVRRSLCFPLHRDWKLSIKVLEDVQNILKCGKKGVLKCLLKVIELLNKTVDSRYILNDLYVTDYCVWIQTVTEKSLEQLRESVENIGSQITKNDVDLDIVLLEAAAKEALKEQEESELARDVRSLELK